MASLRQDPEFDLLSHIVQSPRFLGRRDRSVYYKVKPLKDVTAPQDDGDDRTHAHGEFQVQNSFSLAKLSKNLLDQVANDILERQPHWDITEIWMPNSWCSEPCHGSRKRALLRRI